MNMNEEWPMPLFCPRLHILLLLPLTALSCSSTKSLTDIAGDYKSIIETELLNEIENIGNSLKNRSCSNSEAKLSCSSDRTTIVTTLFTITCRMKNLDVRYTTRLAESIQLSVICPCPEKSIKEPKRSGKTPRNEKHKPKKRGKKKLCRAKTLLSSLAECYHLLNTILSTA